jgi:hypothetical protein
VEENLDSTKLSIRFDLDDHVSHAILRAAEETEASLIVMAGHGLTMPSGMLLGHVADAVASHITRPLLCYKHKGEVVHLLQAVGQLFSQ